MGEDGGKIGEKPRKIGNGTNRARKREGENGIKMEGERAREVELHRGIIHKKVLFEGFIQGTGLF
jgi:hypothetical protein